MTVTLFLLAAPAFAAIELEATAGLGGHTRIGDWTPVRVVVDNKGPATRGELVIPPQPATSDTSDYRVAVDVPPQSRRAFMMYARYQISAAALDVELHAAGQAPTKVKATCSPHEPDSRIVLVISRKAGGLGTIGTVPIYEQVAASRSHAAGESVVAYVTPDRTTGALGLPDRPAGYEAVAAVVLRDISPQDFEPYERDALRAWVEGGGLLVIMSAPNIAELRDSFVEELAPVRIRGQRVLPHLEALAAHFSSVVNYGRALIADTELKPEAELIVAQGGAPLLARGRHESGTVYFCAADCAAPPLQSADLLMREMWATILQDEQPFRNWSPLARLRPGGLDSGPVGLSDAIVRLPVLEWEGFALFGGYLLAYIVVLVAVSLILKRLDRREWAGQAMLIGIAAFSLGALYLAGSSQLAACRTYDAAVATVESGSSVGWLEGVSGIRSPAARKFDVTAAAEQQSIEYVCGARRALSWPLHQQSRFALLDLPIDLWGFGAARVQGPWRLDGTITTSLVPGDSETVGLLVENQTPYELRWPFVLLPASVHTDPETIPAGASREIGRISRKGLQAPRPTEATQAFETLVKHCEAKDAFEEGAPTPEQRMRHRLLRQLGTNEGPDYNYGWFGPGSVPVVPPELNPFNPDQPLFGAWIELPGPLLNVVPAREDHVSQVLLLVDVPVGGSLPGVRPREFADLFPEIDTTSYGIAAADEGRVSLTSGQHELLFRLPHHYGEDRARLLTLNVGANFEGVRAEVRNVRSGRWEQLRVAINDHAQNKLISPDDYVRWPQGWVTARISRAESHETRVYCTLSGKVGG